MNSWIKTTSLWLILVSAPIGLAAEADPLADLKLIGQGEMRWLWFDLYQASLYNQPGQYQAQSYPIALAIDYKRTISQADLIKATVEQWQRLGLDWQAEWVSELTSFWPNVSNNDQLILKINKAQHSQFFYNNQLIGEITDPLFGPTFLAIWLSPDTQEPQLRQALIGSY